MKIAKQKKDMPTRATTKRRYWVRSTSQSTMPTPSGKMKWQK